MSRKTLATTIGALVVAAGLAVVPPARRPRPARRARPRPPAPSGRLRSTGSGARTGTSGRRRRSAAISVVPLDYANPTGPTIQLAVSRILHTKGPYRGAAFANPGGPGASALQYSPASGRCVPHGVGKTYDWYGMDPRGVGASIPALSCDPKYSNTRHPALPARRPRRS